MTLEELCDYIARNADRIYVRAQVSGKWDAYALNALPAQDAIEHALRFVKRGQVPVIFTDADEDEVSS
jgi:hypothetical protein